LPTKSPKAFWSYTHHDDKHARGKLSALRERLEAELESQLGTAFTIFQDAIGLTWGVQWRQRLNSSIDEAIFFIPVITPKYFESEPCRDELTAFLQREQQLLYGELVLPIYWITTSRTKDDLAATIMTRQYADLRKLRLHADDSATDTAVATIATQLIERLHEYAAHQDLLKRASASITGPKKGGIVTRTLTVSGTNTNIPPGLAAWLVVQTGKNYHPQQALPTNGIWTARATVGTNGFGASNNHDFPIHVILTSASANEQLKDYLAQQQKTQAWHGITLPPGTRTLATTTVTRNDYTATLASIIGAYDEYRDRPLQPTGGTITITNTPSGSLNVTATTKAGSVVWRGTITVDAKTGKITGNYQYTATTDQGTQDLTIGKDELSITGQDNSGTKQYYMRWKKR